MLRFEAYRKVIAAALVLCLGLVAQVVPGLDAIPAEAVQGVSGILAVVAVYAVENRLDGQSVDYLARVLRDLVAEALDDDGDPPGEIYITEALAGDIVTRSARGPG